VARSLEITQLYRTFLEDFGHRGLLSIELGYANETVGLLFSKLANPKAKTGTIEIPVTYSRIDEGAGTAPGRIEFPENTGPSSAAGFRKQRKARLPVSAMRNGGHTHLCEVV
jgi:hypothetical protein